MILIKIDQCAPPPPPKFRPIFELKFKLPYDSSTPVVSCGASSYFRGFFLNTNITDRSDQIAPSPTLTMGLYCVPNKKVSNTLFPGVQHTFLKQSFRALLDRWSQRSIMIPYDPYPVLCQHGLWSELVH